MVLTPALQNRMNPFVQIRASALRLREQRNRKDSHACVCAKARERTNIHVCACVCIYVIPPCVPFVPHAPCIPGGGGGGGRSRSSWRKPTDLSVLPEPELRRLMELEAQVGGGAGVCGGGRGRGGVVWGLGGWDEGGATVAGTNS